MCIFHLPNFMIRFIQYYLEKKNKIDCSHNFFIKKKVSIKIIILCFRFYRILSEAIMNKRLSSEFF